MDQTFATFFHEYDDNAKEKIAKYFPVFKIGYVVQEPQEEEEQTGSASHSWDTAPGARDNVAPVEASYAYRSWVQDAKANQGDATVPETANLYTCDMDANDVIEYVRTSLTETVTDNLPSQDNVLGTCCVACVGLNA